MWEIKDQTKKQQHGLLSEYESRTKSTRGLTESRDLSG